MTNAPAWRITADPAAVMPEAATSVATDTLLTDLADVDFTASAEPAASRGAPPAVPPLPVHAVDPDHQVLHAALQAGTIPTFADDPATSPTIVTMPLDAAAEREAYAAFLQFIQQHKGDGTTLTFMDPDDYALSLI